MCSSPPLYCSPLKIPHHHKVVQLRASTIDGEFYAVQVGRFINSKIFNEIKIHRKIARGNFHSKKEITPAGALKHSSHVNSNSHLFAHFACFTAINISILFYFMADTVMNFHMLGFHNSLNRERESE